MATISIKDEQGAELLTTDLSGKGLGKYFKSAASLRALVPLAQIFSKPLGQGGGSSTLALTLESEVPVGRGGELNITAGASIGIGLHEPGGRLFEGSDLQAPVEVPNGTAYTSITLEARLKAAGSQSAGHVSFGFGAGTALRVLVLPPVRSRGRVQHRGGFGEDDAGGRRVSGGCRRPLPDPGRGVRIARRRRRTLVQRRGDAQLDHEPSRHPRPAAHWRRDGDGRRQRGGQGRLGRQRGVRAAGLAGGSVEGTTGVLPPARAVAGGIGDGDGRPRRQCQGKGPARGADDARSARIRRRISWPWSTPGSKTRRSRPSSRRWPPASTGR